MTVAEIGKPVPDVELPATGDKSIKFSDYQGKTVVLFFYPRASTPGCTEEGQNFRDAITKFRRQRAVVIGASRDSLKAQENFKSKQGFPYDLISDADENLCSIFNVIKLKNMYGKKVRGIERSTFLIDAEGVLRREWRKVKTKGHVDEVLAAVKELKTD